MIVIKVVYHLQRCSRSFDLRAQWKHMNNGEKRILNAVYTEQKAGVTKLNNRMQEDSVIRGWGYTERIVYILTELSMSSI
ncbi:hypothetical protein T07_7098 [Trichinella nelsoni]|uniref:Uncharacterized protein n=1 Tax=Trichinella nelsoni TaxID=6336 RepID=A0A0V0S782_9BILA|nr:hypothetical protein T07_7098 [Trichinella nelsoni]